MHKTLFALALLAACGGDTSNIVDNTPDDVGGDENPDTTGPTITHEPIDASQPLGEDVLILATVVDDESSVFVVEVFYRSETSTTWSSGKPLALQNGETGEFQGVIPGTEVTGGGMDYYLHAVDSSNNDTFLPEDAEVRPYHFRVDGG